MTTMGVISLSCELNLEIDFSQRWELGPQGSLGNSGQRIPLSA